MPRSALCLLSIGVAVEFSLAGPALAKKTDPTQMNLEQDYATFVQVCKQAPKESLWTKLKMHFGGERK